MTIQQFIDRVREERLHRLRTRPASEVLIGPLDDINWPLTFEEAGYYPHHLNSIKGWEQIHAWCHEHIGEEHYAWTGAIFWFERHDDAVFFKLKWS